MESVKLIGQDLKVSLADTIFKDKDLESYALAVLPNSCDQGYGIFTIDENSAYFFEKYLGDLFNSADINFTKTHFLVVLDIVFKMMENGLCSV